MKTPINLILLSLFSVSLFAQNTKADFAKAVDSIRYGSYTFHLPENMPCDSVYEVFSKYNEYKGSKGVYNDPKREELGRMTSLTLRYKIQFYKQLHQNDTCAPIREKLMEEFIYALKNDSTDKDMFSDVLELFQEFRKDKISEKYNFRALMLDLMKRDDIYKSNYYSTRIISYFSLSEYTSRFWEIFHKEEPSKDAYSRFTSLLTINRLGDSLKAHHQYTKDMWEVVMSDEKVIDNMYFYYLEDRIDKDTPFRREKIEQLFEMLKYLYEHPKKNKKYLWRYEDGPLYTDMQRSIYHDIRNNVKLPESIGFISKEYTNHDIEKLLNWYKKHPHFELKEEKK